MLTRCECYLNSQSKIKKRAYAIIVMKMSYEFGYNSKILTFNVKICGDRGLIGRIYLTAECKIYVLQIVVVIKQ